MAVGFLKGIWGKPAQRGTGVYGLWGTIKRTPGTIMGTIMKPVKLITGLIILVIGVLLYKRIK